MCRDGKDVAFFFIFQNGAEKRDTERTRGSFTVRDTEVFFAIDYYDAALEYGSEDPADAGVTTRVLTLMLREDL